MTFINLDRVKQWRRAGTHASSARATTSGTILHGSTPWERKCWVLVPRCAPGSFSIRFRSRAGWRLSAAHSDGRMRQEGHADDARAPAALHVHLRALQLDLQTQEGNLTPETLIT